MDILRAAQIQLILAKIEDEMNLYEKTMQAIRDLFSDTSVSPSTTRINLRALIDEIEILIESLPED